MVTRNSKILGDVNHMKFGKGGHRNAIKLALAAAVVASMAQAQGPAPVTASIAYIAFGGVVTPTNVNAWTTEFIFTNLGSATATVGLRWYGDSGNPLPVPVLGVNRSTIHEFQIAAGATLDIQLDNTQDPLTEGWVAVDVIGSVNGQAIFHSDLTGRPEYSAAAPLTFHGLRTGLVLLGGGVPVTTVLAPESLALPFNNVNNITGVSFANITDSPQALTLNYVDDNGNQLMSQTINLAPGAHTAFPANDPRVLGTKGTIVVAGDGSPYTAIAFVMGQGANAGTIATLLPVIR